MLTFCGHHGKFETQSAMWRRTVAFMHFEPGVAGATNLTPMPAVPARSDFSRLAANSSSNPAPFCFDKRGPYPGSGHASSVRFPSPHRCKAYLQLHEEHWAPWSGPIVTCRRTSIVALGRTLGRLRERYGPQSYRGRTLCGSMGLVPRRTSKWTWGPVARPVRPTWAMVCP